MSAEPEILPNDAQKRQAVLQKFRDRQEQSLLEELPLPQAPAQAMPQLEDVQPQVVYNAIPLEFLKTIQDWVKAPEVAEDCSSRSELEEYKRQLQHQYKTLVALVQMTADELGRLDKRLARLLK
ncbi:MAG: hypothetical protein KME03_01905 [Aphanocapsa lilacina HA4352-LM1]|jgi:hypothetical protein|nr:hypothetical protein [Aphanocapsa lilacina HA4352-LM1]